jgi:AraC-like DNA-binding protein
MKALHFSTEGLDPTQRGGYWNAVNAELFGPLRAEFPPDARSQANLWAYDFGELRLCRVRGPAHCVQREQRCSVSAARGSLKLVYQRAGVSELLHANGRGRVEQGEWVAFDPTLPYRLSTQSNTSLLIVQIPETLLRNRTMSAIVPSTLVSSDGVAQTVASFLAWLDSTADALAESVSPLMSEALLSLLLTSVFSAAPAPSSDVIAEAFRARVRQFIKANIADPELSPASISRHLRCSKRYLHRMFEAEDVTLERYIWRARLELSKARLDAPGAASVSISEVAFDSGFSSSSHFCHVFKATYGLSPSRFREQQLTRLAAGTSRDVACEATASH